MCFFVCRSQVISLEIVGTHILGLGLGLGLGLKREISLGSSGTEACQFCVERVMPSFLVFGISFQNSFPSVGIKTAGRFLLITS